MLWIVLANGYATILRLPCLKYADFNVFHVNKLLRGHLIYKESGLNDVQCMEKCVKTTNCRSYNINNKLQLCELNGKMLGDGGTTQLSHENGWIYKSTNPTAKLVIHSLHN